MNSVFPNILPFERAYWVIPGMLLAGNVPYNEDHEAGKANLIKLINVGIRSIVNLMDVNEFNLNGSPIPNYQNILDEITSAHNINFDFKRFTIPDYSIPSNETMMSILDFIDECLLKKKPVYVHCWGGKGRTGTVVGCYLIRHGLANYNNVEEMISYLRRTDPKANFKSPETIEQLNFVKSWKIKH